MTCFQVSKWVPAEVEVLGEIHWGFAQDGCQHKHPYAGHATKWNASNERQAVGLQAQLAVDDPAARPLAAISPLDFADNPAVRPMQRAIGDP